MKDYHHKTEIMVTERRHPVGYRLQHLDGRPDLFIPGHYKIACGGIDRLKTLAEAYALIRMHNGLGMDVLYEGKNGSDRVHHLYDLTREIKHRVTVVVVKHDLVDCINAVHERGHVTSAKQIHHTAVKVDYDANWFERVGYEVHRLNRTEALAKCREILARGAPAYEGGMG